MNHSEKNLKELVGLSAYSSVCDRLYQRISGLIMSGELEEGYMFPNESVLCEQLNVGRTTLREAYKALELSGYITRSKRGTVVNSRSAIINATPLKKLFGSASNEDFTQFRLMVESESASLAAANASLSDVEALDRVIDQLRDARDLGDHDRLMELDDEFHVRIARMSGNSLIGSIVIVMAEEWREGIRRNFEAVFRGDREKIDRMIEHHSSIAGAIRARDAKAGSLMAEHIREMTGE
jgi:GntR family transcriptional repressor for pyruvate dehydrogenase complex